MIIDWNDLREYAQGKADRQTRLRVEKWLAKSPANQNYFKKICRFVEDPQTASSRNSLLRPKSHNANRITKLRTRVALWSSCAATVCAAVAVAIIILGPKPTPTPQPSAQYALEQIPSNGIVIKTDEGREYQIDRIAAGKDSVENVSLNLNEKLLSYNTDNSVAKIEYHTIEVPLSRLFKIELADGSVVILNSGSSLRYPTSFAAGQERRVELTGEAYFEVAHDSQRQFAVITANSRVEVYGTRFLVNAYADSPQSTLLVEGKVGVTVDNSLHLLAPGQLLTVDKGGVLIERANAENYLSWINGYFTFEDMPIARIAVVLSQWYGVGIEVDSAISNRLFNCNIPCFNNLETVLKVLADTRRMNYRANESGYMIW